MSEGRARAAGLVILLVLAGGAGRAAGRPLPSPGPPPDPSRGETYDGRRRLSESTGRKVALFVPRAILVLPRFALGVIRVPVIAVLEYTERTDEGRRQGPRRDARSGFVPLLGTSSADELALGARYWTRSLLPERMGTASFWAMTSGPRFIEGGMRFSPNSAQPIAVGGWLRGLHRTNERDWGVAGEVDPGADPDDLLRTVAVDAVDGAGTLVLRPGGAAGGWRTTFIGGAGLRRFDIDPDGTFVRGGLIVDRIGTFDVSRDLSGLDVTWTALSTVGVAGDASRYLTTTLHAAYGVPAGGGRALVLSAIAGDQISWGDDEPTFYDRLSPGSHGFLRGFSVNRFRGPAIAAAALDVRMPLAMTIDAFVFVEEGGAFDDHFQGFDAEALRTSLGTGVRFFWSRHVLELTVGWGVGEGLRFGFSFDSGS